MYYYELYRNCAFPGSERRSDRQLASDRCTEFPNGSVLADLLRRSPGKMDLWKDIQTEQGKRSSDGSLRLTLQTINLGKTYKCCIAGGFSGAKMLRFFGQMINVYILLSLYLL